MSYLQALIKAIAAERAEADALIRDQTAEIARLSMMLEAVKAWAEGKPSNPPKTGIAPSALNPEPQQ